MKVTSTSILAVASVVAVAHGSSSELVQGVPQEGRGLATLAEKWQLVDPTFSFEANTFSLGFNVTDYITSGQSKFSLWQDVNCQDGGNPLGLDNGVWDGTPSLSENTLLVNGALDNEAPYSGRAATVAATFNPEVVTGSAIYDERITGAGVTIAEIEFCIRFGLWTTLDMGVTTPVEVNFLETIVTLFVDLTDGFKIQDISVTPKERLVRTANQAYEVRGFLCSTDGTTSEVTDGSSAFNQGTAIGICVVPEDEATAAGIYMRSIDDFTFERVVDGADNIQQIAIQNKKAAGNLLTEYDPSACIGKPLCVFNTILFAQFYLGTPGVVGTVTGFGTATMQFGQQTTIPTRRLRASSEGLDDARDLQEEEGAGASEFDLTFGVNPATPRGEDSAAPSSNMMATVLSLGGAVVAAVALM